MSHNIPSVRCSRPPNFGSRAGLLRVGVVAPDGRRRRCVPAMLLLVANIAGWFAVSIFLTLYNKLSVTTWGMDFPLTIACVHLVMRMPMAAVAMRYLGVRAFRFSWRELCVSYFPVSALIALRCVENKTR